jgi:hypothetical protein
VLAIRSKINEVTGLNASAGISYNKFLAKLASDHRKPNGQYVITPEMGLAFVENLPVGKFHGIGPATSTKMNALGLYTGLDMRNQPLEFMQTNFGKAGSYYYWISRGVDNREVRADRIRKSVGPPQVLLALFRIVEARDVHKCAAIFRSHSTGGRVSVQDRCNHLLSCLDGGYADCFQRRAFQERDRDKRQSRARRAVDGSVVIVHGRIPYGVNVSDHAARSARQERAEMARSRSPQRMIRRRAVLWHIPSPTSVRRGTKACPTPCHHRPNWWARSPACSAFAKARLRSAVDFEKSKMAQHSTSSPI